MKKLDDTRHENTALKERLLSNEADINETQRLLKENKEINENYNILLKEFNLINEKPVIIQHELAANQEEFNEIKEKYNSHKEISSENTETKHKSIEMNKKFNEIYRKYEDMNALMNEKDINRSLFEINKELEVKVKNLEESLRDFENIKEINEKLQGKTIYLEENINDLTERYNLLKNQLKQSNPDLKPIIESIEKTENSYNVLKSSNLALSEDNNEIRRLYSQSKKTEETISKENEKLIIDINKKNIEIDELKQNAKAFEYNLLKPIPVAMKSFDEQLKVRVIE